MKVELILNDDLELKAYIKELIKNEIINSSREQIKEVIEATLDKKVGNSSDYESKNIDLLIKKSM